MGGTRVHFEVYIRKIPGGPWALDLATENRAAAMQTAQDLMAEGRCAAVKVTKVNVDENPNLAAQYGVRSIPMLLFIKNGEVKDTVVGVQSKDALKRLLERHM